MDPLFLYKKYPAVMNHDNVIDSVKYVLLKIVDQLNELYILPSRREIKFIFHLVYNYSKLVFLNSFDFKGTVLRSGKMEFVDDDEIDEIIKILVFKNIVTRIPTMVKTFVQESKIPSSKTQWPRTSDEDIAKALARHKGIRSKAKKELGFDGALLKARIREAGNGSPLAKYRGTRWPKTPTDRYIVDFDLSEFSIPVVDGEIYHYCFVYRKKLFERLGSGWTSFDNVEKAFCERKCFLSSGFKSALSSGKYMKSFYGIVGEFLDNSSKLKRYEKRPKYR